jgi:hypothetical protein
VVTWKNKRNLKTVEVDLKAARDTYGVVFQRNCSDIKKILVDYVGTQELRNKMMLEVSK